MWQLGRTYIYICTRVYCDIIKTMYDLTLSQTTKLILDSSKLKQFADDDVIFDENGRKFFLFLVFSSLVMQTRKKQGLFWKGLISLFLFCENIKHYGNRRSAGYQHFSPFPTMFSKGLFLRFVLFEDCIVKVKLYTCYSQFRFRSAYWLPNLRRIYY